MSAMWRAAAVTYPVTYPVTYHQTFLSKTYLRTYNRAYKSFLSGTTFPKGDQKFFNRNNEVQMLQEVLKAEPQFSLLTGPVHSGKSTLVTQVLDKLSTEKPKPAI